MTQIVTLSVVIPIALLAALVTGFLIYVVIRYTPIIGRIFEEKPLFAPLRGPLEPGGEEVRFLTPDGLDLAGTYWPARTVSRAGVIVFCHEFLGDRWGALVYADHLRDLGFDLFAFDFRNHGDSESDPVYSPLQWVTDHEVNDLRGALAYLNSRPDRDPAGVGLFGISRGGGAALCLAAREPGVWGVVTDGAFPTRGTMLAYIQRWAEIYVGWPAFYRRVPLAVFRLLGWAGRVRSERRLSCRFPDVERAAARLSPRPWLAIHGARDAYIGPEIARHLFDQAREPKEFWLVPDAKHNRGREVDPEGYRTHLVTFFRDHAPRRLPLEISPAVHSEAHSEALHPAEPVVSGSLSG